MSKQEQQHKTCNLKPRFGSTDGVRFMCNECGRDIFYTQEEIKELTPYTLKEVSYYLFHKYWEWEDECINKECEHCK